MRFYSLVSQCERIIYESSSCIRSRAQNHILLSYYVGVRVEVTVNVC